MDFDRTDGDLDASLTALLLQQRGGGRGPRSRRHERRRFYGVAI
jgi:hypothetical protein